MQDGRSDDDGAAAEEDCEEDSWPHAVEVPQLLQEVEEAVVEGKLTGSSEG